MAIATQGKLKAAYTKFASEIFPDDRSALFMFPSYQKLRDISTNAQERRKETGCHDGRAICGQREVGIQQIDLIRSYFFYDCRDKGKKMLCLTY